MWWCTSGGTDRKLGTGSYRHIRQLRVCCSCIDRCLTIQMTTHKLLTDKYGKPVAFREKVAAAQAVVVQIAADVVVSKDGRSLPLGLIGALADQLYVLASLGVQLKVVCSDAAEKAAFSLEAMLKLKDPVVPMSFCSDAEEHCIAASQAGAWKADLIIYLSNLSGVKTAEGKVLQVYTPPLSSAEQANGNGSSASSAQHASNVASRAPTALEQSAWETAQSGTAVILADACTPDVLLKLLAGQDTGTLFDTHAATAAASSMAQGSSGAHGSGSSPARDMAVRARAASRALQALSTAERVAILLRIADALVQQQDVILAANAKDVAEWQGKIADAMLQRLILKPAKLAQLAEGIRNIAAQEEPIGRPIKKLEVADGLTLTQLTAPIGVLLIIYESRPDALPQIVSLALRSGNGLLLKGGREAVHSNAALHAAVTEAIGPLGPDLVGLVISREEISELLALDDVIDLAIPRGSNSLVSYIQRNTRIPVLGHADGVCHMYIDASASPELAVELAVDAKVDYPAACNAVEKVLIHSSFLEGGLSGVQLIRSAMESAGVTVHAGEHLSALLSDLPHPPAPRHEYGCLGVTLEIVNSMQEAIDHIHKFGSSHTECIVTEDAEAAETFLRTVDSACVFHNASTRFADGFRFGLGAEVGISTSRIHARGPVGVEGLLTTKWQLRGSGQKVAKDTGVKYTFKPLPLTGETDPAVAEALAAAHIIDTA